MGSKDSARHAFFSPQYFGLVIGLIVFAVFLVLGQFTDSLKNLETRVTDLHFNLKQSLLRESNQENVVAETRSHKLSDDIIIIGIDGTTLDALGRWPFPRSYHADLLNAFTRISNQSDRESAILLDILFNDVAERPFEDVVLLDAIKENGRVALQTQLFANSGVGSISEELDRRFDTLLANYGEITRINGDYSAVPAYYGIESPLIPYGREVGAYGHASYRQDVDKNYRRQQLVARYSEKISEFRIDELEPGSNFGTSGMAHLAWVNRQEQRVPVSLPLTEKSLDQLKRDLKKNALPRVVLVDPDGDGKGTTREEYYVSVYQDHFIPAISLTLALQYFNKSLNDIEVEFGSHILIPSPQQWDPVSEAWVPYSIPNGRGGIRRLDEIRIPIDGSGNMLINFMGPRSSPERGGVQTFPVRSYSTYAQSVRGSNPDSWPKTKAVGGKILMVGAFTLGMADDEKTTPLGLMFGVEIHANALNTIVMDNFLRSVPKWVNLTIMLVLVLLTAFITSRMSKLGWSIVIVLAYLAVSFLLVSFLFEFRNIVLDWGSPALAVMVCFVAVVVYRVLSAERDKRNIKSVFGQFISPAIVEELSQTPPELGGEDADVSVFFSDIRGFSTMSERMTPQQLVSLLNEYLTDMTDSIVNDWEGTLDKYIGDAIMAFWGAPRAQEDHAVRACKCAVMNIRLLNMLNEKWKNDTEKPVQHIDIGIGINSGTSTVGYMGSEGRKNYTAMGDTVNLAARLEGVNKMYSTQILISEDTKKKIEHEPFVLRELDEIRVKGKLQPVTIYEVLDYEGELENPVKTTVKAG